MSLPSENIKNFIEAASSLTLVFGTDLFIGKEPEDPINCVTIFDTGGRGPFLHGQRADADSNIQKYEYASVQIRVRNSSYLTGMNLARSILEALHQRGNEMDGNDKVTLIQALDHPFLLGYDDNNRPMIVTNFEIQRIPET